MPNKRMYNSKRENKCNISKLQDPDIQIEFEECVKTELEKEPRSKDVQTDWTLCQNVVKETMKKYCGKSVKKTGLILTAEM